MHQTGGHGCARWEHMLADPGCSGWERLVCGHVWETAGARSPGRIDGGTVVDLQEDCGLRELKTDAPVQIDAPQKIEDPGLCRDPFQIEVRRTPEAQLPHRRMNLPTPISSIAITDLMLLSASPRVTLFM